MLVSGFILTHKKMSNDMNEYQREINWQRNQGIEPKFNDGKRMLTRKEINTIRRAHRRWNRGTRKVVFKPEANLRLFHHTNEAGRGMKGNNHTLSNKSKRKLSRIPKSNSRAKNLKKPLEWEHYQSSEPNEQLNRPLGVRLIERGLSKRLLNYLRNTGKLFVNENKI